MTASSNVDRRVAWGDLDFLVCHLLTPPSSIKHPAEPFSPCAPLFSLSLCASPHLRDLKEQGPEHETAMWEEGTHLEPKRKKNKNKNKNTRRNRLQPCSVRTHTYIHTHITGKLPADPDCFLLSTDRLGSSLEADKNAGCPFSLRAESVHPRFRAYGISPPRKARRCDSS